MGTERDICHYCREPLNEGARYCRGCGGKQPRLAGSARAKSLLPVVVAVVMMALVGPTAYFLSVYQHRQYLLDRLHLCALRANKVPVPTRIALAAEVDAEVHRKPWLEAVQVVGARHGCTCSASSCVDD